MTQFYLILFWMACAGIATAVGYDRGRWLAGILLGVAGGPVGAIAAGLLRLSPEIEAEQRFAVDRQLSRMKHDEVTRMRQRQTAKRQVDYLIGALEEQVERRRLGLADGLDELAEQLADHINGDEEQSQRVKGWVTWLQQNARSVRSNRDEPVEQAELP